MKLAKRYEAALLQIDTVVKEAIANSNTPAGKKARELCSEAAKRRAEEIDGVKGEDGKVPGLSVEAVNAHTMGSGMLKFFDIVLRLLTCAMNNKSYTKQIPTNTFITNVQDV